MNKQTVAYIHYTFEIYKSCVELIYQFNIRDISLQSLVHPKFL